MYLRHEPTGTSGDRALPTMENEVEGGKKELGGFYTKTFRELQEIFFYCFLWRKDT